MIATSGYVSVTALLLVVVDSTTWILNLYIEPLRNSTNQLYYIVRVIEPQRFRIVLRNGIFEGVYLI
jgi:hypothetical protein